MLRVPGSAEEMRSIEALISRICLLDAEFPEWPFRFRGNVIVYDFLEVLSPDFGAVLWDLSVKYRDECVDILGWNGKDYLASYGGYPGFRVSGPGIAQDYWSGLSVNQPNEMGKYNVGEVLYDFVAMAGSSSKWALWGQRDWDTALLVTPDPMEGIDSPVQKLALENLTDPDYVAIGFGLSIEDWKALRRNCEQQPLRGRD